MKLLYNILFLIALALFSINISGLFISLRNPEIYREPGNDSKDDITLSYREFMETVENTSAESKKAAVIELTYAVSRGIAHYWRDEGIEKYNLRIPFYENYLLFLASYLWPEKFLKYEFVDYKKAVERGVGLCSQHAVVLSQVLEQKGIESVILLLSGHVLVMALVDEISDTWWTLDPDLGAVIKYGINEIEENPSLVIEYYQERGLTNERINFIAGLFKRPGNRIFPGVKEYLAFNYKAEKLAYLLIWLIPAIISIRLILRLKRRS